MRHTKKVLLAVLLAVLGLIGTSSPAAAATTGSVTFVADMTTSCGLGYPIVTPAASCGITFTTNVCVDAMAGKKTSAGVCAFTGAGTITGHCGASSGWIWGGITKSNGHGATFHIHFQTAGSVVVATGTVSFTGQTGPVTVEADATPVPSIGGPSCLTGTQTQFFAVGEATFVTT